MLRREEQGLRVAPNNSSKAWSIKKTAQEVEPKNKKIVLIIDISVTVFNECLSPSNNLKF